MTPGTHSDGALPRRPIDPLTRAFERFLHIKALSGVLLMNVTVIALLIANSGWSTHLDAALDGHLVVGASWLRVDYPLRVWINDALMALFFFVMGLEIKRELVLGELRDLRNVVLPTAGAIGGVVVPVLLFLALSPPEWRSSGWAIPMATDIAFVVGALALLGDRIPAALKVFMLSLAIADDVLAVGVVAFVFTDDLNHSWLLAAAVGIALVITLNVVRVRAIGPYFVVGSVVWLCTLKSGVHPTVAGVLLGLLTPARPWLDDARFQPVLDRLSARLSSAAIPSPERKEALGELAFASTEAISPLERLEHALHPWVALLIMPVFALANAGVAISAARFADPAALALAAALVLGKPLGIIGGAWLVARLGRVQLQEGLSWRLLSGAACLGGIGFTMSLFIASLRLETASLEVAKAGVLLGSSVSLVLGLGLLWAFTGRRSSAPAH